MKLRSMRVKSLTKILYNIPQIHDLSFNINFWLGMLTYLTNYVCLETTVLSRGQKPEGSPLRRGRMQLLMNETSPKQS